MKQRNEYLDIVKGIAITLVVLGHSIQYGTFEFSGDQYFNNALFQLIYSFHMPLFMLVSGYLFYYSTARHSDKYNFHTRLTTLIIPIIAWNIINLAAKNIVLFIKGNNITWEQDLLSFLNATWFLWSIFWCSSIVLIVKKLFNDHILIYITIGMLALFLSDHNNVFGISYHVYMYPYFITGYLWNKYKADNRFAFMGKTGKSVSLIMLLVIFSLMLIRFEKNDFVYISGTSILINGKISLDQITTDFYRYLIGFVGSACILMITHSVYKSVPKIVNKIFASLGQRSMGIYVITVPFVNLWILQRIPHVDLIPTGGAFIEAIIILPVCYEVTILLEKNKLSKMILLGSR